MSERVLHEWIEQGGWIRQISADGKSERCRKETGRPDSWTVWATPLQAETEEIARLAARVAELEAENAKLRACVKASDDARGDGCCPVCDSEAGASHWIDCPWRDYDAARAEVDK